MSHTSLRTESRALCSKCHNNCAAVWTQAGIKCMPCFMSGLERSFKVALGRFGFSGRAVHPTGVLVSGGPCSSAVASLYVRYLASLPPNPRAAEQKVLLVHVNCGDPFAHARVESLAAQLAVDRVITEPPEMPVLKDVSDTEIIFRRRVVNTAIRTAGEVGCIRVLLGTTADRAAVNILSCVLSGCGAQVEQGGQDAFRVEAMGPGGAPVLVLRPLLHTPVRLAVRYAREATACGGAVGDTESSVPTKSRSIRNRPGLYGVLERFVASAQADNGACVHNVVRTAARLGSIESSATCSLCGGTVTDSEVPKGLKACGSEGGMSCDAACDRCCSSTFQPFDGSPGAALLCYSCEEAVRRAGGRTAGGAGILSIAGREARRRAMRSEIQEFLIEDDPVREDQDKT